MGDSSESNSNIDEDRSFETPRRNDHMALSTSEHSQEVDQENNDSNQRYSSNELHGRSLMDLTGIDEMELKSSEHSQETGQTNNDADQSVENLILAGPGDKVESAENHKDDIDSKFYNKQSVEDLRAIEVMELSTSEHTQENGQTNNDDDESDENLIQAGQGDDKVEAAENHKDDNDSAYQKDET